MSDGRYRVVDERTFDTFKKRFSMLIDSRGFNLVQTANATNINVTSISRYLNSRNPDTLAIWRIADVFGVSIDWLLGRTDERYSDIPEKELDLLTKYKVASDNDKLVIDTILSKYDRV